MSLSAEAQNAFLTAAVAAGASRGIEPAPLTSWIEIIGDTRCDTCSAILALAGVEQYTSNTAYRVPVRRRDQDGLLVVAGPTIDPPRLVPAPDSPPAAFRVIRDSKGEPAALVEYPADPQERAYRVEVRIDLTWLSTLIIYARDEIQASDEAIKEEAARLPGADLDVWSVSLDEEVVEEFPAVVLGATTGLPESGPGAGADPGGAAPLHGPGSPSLRSSPAVDAGDSGLERSPGFSQRCENQAPLFPKTKVLYVPPLDRAVLEKYDDRKLVEIAESGSIMRRSALYLLAWRASGAAEPSPLPEAPFTRHLRVPIGPESHVAVSVVGFENLAIPTPLEPSDYEPFKPSVALLGEVFSTLHRAQSFDPFHLTP